MDESQKLRETEDKLALLARMISAHSNDLNRQIDQARQFGSVIDCAILSGRRMEYEAIKDMLLASDLFQHKK